MAIAARTVALNIIYEGLALGDDLIDNDILDSRQECQNHTQFMTKTADKPYPLGLHISPWEVGGGKFSPAKYTCQPKSEVLLVHCQTFKASIFVMHGRIYFMAFSKHCEENRKYHVHIRVRRVFKDNFRTVVKYCLECLKHLLIQN